MYIPKFSLYIPGEMLYPAMNENDFFHSHVEKLKLNTSYLVKIAPHKQTRIDQYYEGDECLTDEEFRSRNISKDMCVSDCEQRIYGPACWNFVHLGYFHGSTVPGQRANTSVPLWSSLIHDFKDPRDWSECQKREKENFDRCTMENCLPQCEEWIYDIIILVVTGRRIMTHIREAALTVVFSYQIKSGTVVVEEQATYTWHTFLSNVGGQTGLWLGISVLSVCQFVFFLFRWVEYRLHKKAEVAIHHQHERHTQHKNHHRS
jgi:hypothetical protein